MSQNSVGVGGSEAARIDRGTWIAFVLMVVLAGGNAVAVRFSNSELPPFWGAALRFAAAALIFWIMVAVRRIALPKGRALIGVLLYGLLAVGASYALLYWALIRATASLAGATLAFVPLMILFFGPDMSSRPDPEKPLPSTAKDPFDVQFDAAYDKWKAARKAQRETLAKTYECSPLHMAALEGNADEVRSLLAQGADVNATTKTGSTPLWYADATGHKDIAQMLRSKGALPVGRSYGYVLISIKGAIGAKNTTAEWFERELRKAAAIEPDVVVLEIDTPGGSTMHAKRMSKAIIRYKNLRFVAFVRNAISAGVPIVLACREIYFADGAIMGAAPSFLPDRRGLPMKLPQDYQEKMQSLWRARCRIAAEHGGHSPLISEAMIDMDFVLTMREEDGRKIIERNGKGKVLKARGKILTLTGREAVACGLAKSVAANLSELGEHLKMPRWNRAREDTKQRPLHRATEEGDLPLILELCNKGKINEKDKDGQTPLHLAAQKGYVDIARALIDKGADVNAKNNYGGTPLRLAAWMGKADIAKVLIDKGADVNVKSKDGETPLHMAARWGHADIAKALII